MLLPLTFLNVALLAVLLGLLWDFILLRANKWQDVH